MRSWGLAAALLLAVAACNSDSDSDRTLQPLSKSASLPRYEIIQNNGPVVVVMLASVEESLRPSLGRIHTDLISAGYTLLALDLPCHGADAEPGDDPLGCWRRRIAGGDHELFRRYCAGLAAVLDELKLTNVRVLGLSRGGYLAITCAAYDLRLQDIALIAPVTNLANLFEFNGFKVDQASSISCVIAMR
jgi:pimeloyl-ACP methyl ester carboxylesterase